MRTQPQSCSKCHEDNPRSLHVRGKQLLCPTCKAAHEREQAAQDAAIAAKFKPEDTMPMFGEKK